MLTISRTTATRSGTRAGGVPIRAVASTARAIQAITILYALFIDWGYRIAMAASPERVDAYGSYREAPLALVPLLGAVALLIVSITQLAVMLPPELGALRVIASVGVSAGMLWAIAPWTGILGATFFGATAVVAVGAWRAAVIPGRLAAALVVALGGPTALFIATMVLPWYVMRQAGAGAFVFPASVLLVWPLVALCLRSARRAGPRPTGGDAAGSLTANSRCGDEPEASPSRRRPSFAKSANWRSCSASTVEPSPVSRYGRRRSTGSSASMNPRSSRRASAV